MATLHCRSSSEADALRRQLVLALRLSQRRRVFETHVHIGDAPNTSVAFEIATNSKLDMAARCDVIGTLIGRAPRPQLVWITRCGHTEISDEDLAWLAAAQAAFREAATPLELFLIVTRYGWLDPQDGTTHTWRRLRNR